MANYHTLMSVHLIDADGDAGEVALHQSLVDTTTLAGVVTLLSGTAGFIESCIDGQILSGTATIKFPLTAGKGSPVANCEAEKGALLSFTAAGTAYRHSIFIPTFKPSLFIGDEVDIVDASVAALITNLEGAYTDKYDNDLTALLTAVKKFRK